MFNERKAAQVAVWFLRRQRGRMAHLKLVKLMYLADREAMRRYGCPITGDQVVAMPHGPVLSMTLNHVNGDLESGPDGWERWISDRRDHQVALRRRAPGANLLDELSASDLEVLGRTWRRFGRMTKWQIRDYTHRECPEWLDPRGSSQPITYEAIFLALGHAPADAARLAGRLQRQQDLDQAFASI